MRTFKNYQKQEEFERINIAKIGEPAIPVYKIRCCKFDCRNSDTVNLSGHRRFPPDYTAKIFQGRGWDIHHGKRTRDICPDCVARHRLKVLPGIRKASGNVINIIPTYEEYVNPPTMEEIVAIDMSDYEKQLNEMRFTKKSDGEIMDDVTKGLKQMVEVERPEPMTREEKRVIFAKLNEVYIDEKIGYGAGWTDDKVASDLGVPRAWVSKIREEDFGPEASNEEIRGLLSQAQTLVADVRSHVATFHNIQDSLESFHKLAKKIEAEINPLQMQCNRIDKHLERIAKQVGVK